MDEFSLDLTKGMTLDLTKKAGNTLTRINAGVTWGKQVTSHLETVKEGGFFGFGSKEVTKEVITEKDIDLDLSLLCYDINKKLISKIYYGNKWAQGIAHSGDDLVGGIRNADNETIELDFSKIDIRINSLVFVLVSFQGIPFKNVNQAEIKLYDASKPGVPVLIKSTVDADEKFGNSTGVIFCSINKTSSGWEVKSICEPAKSRGLDGLLSESVQYI